MSNSRFAYIVALFVATVAFCVSVSLERRYAQRKSLERGVRIKSMIGGQVVCDFTTTNLEVVLIEWTTNKDLTVSGQVVTQSLVKFMR